MIKWILFLLLTVLPVTFAVDLYPSGKDSMELPEVYVNTQVEVLAEETDIAAEYFNNLVKRSRFNGSMLVAKHGQIVFAGTHGVKNFRTKDSLTVNTAFQLASVSKQFTATAILLLAERGQLALNDTITKFIPELPYKDITVEMLLTHRSGLPNYMYFADALTDRNTLLTNEDLIRLMATHKPGIYYRANKRYDYSNTGYALLASIVERVAGKNFASFMDDEFFMPLGMRNTFIFDPTADYSGTDMATGHQANKRKVPHNYLDGVSGDKGVYSTVHDLFLWDQSLYAHILLSPRTVASAFESSIPYKNKYHRNYGYGWKIQNYKDGSKMVYHTGWWHGFNSIFVRMLPNETTLIILANKRTGSFFRTYRGFVAKLNIAKADKLEEEALEDELLTGF